MGRLFEASGISLLRRGIARASEMGLVGWVLETIGVIDGFTDAMAHSSTAFGAGLIAVTGSAIYDVLELATRPEIALKSCDDPQQSLPME